MFNEKGTTMRRIVIILATLALAACGTSTANPGGPQASTSTTLLPPSSTTAHVTSSTAAPETTTTTEAGTTTTTVAAATTTAAGQTTTSTSVGAMVVAPYFYIDEDGHPNRTGPFVFPMARQVDRTVAVARAAMEQLLAGPTTAERQSVPSISTAMPSGVKLLGLTINGDIATVDLSSEFEASDNSAAAAQRAAQVVFTLSRFDSIAEMLFRQEGKPVSIQIGDGSMVSRPVGIWDYLEFAAAITVESPVYGGPGGNPLRVTGFAAVFEATFQYALTDANGLIIEEGIAMTNNGTGWGGFDFTVDYEVDRRQTGALIVWAHSAKDGSRIDIREYPVVLTP
jgi:spore germination protein GerM